MGSASRGGFSSIPGLHFDSWTTCTPASPSTVIAFQYAVGSPRASEHLVMMDKSLSLTPRAILQANPASQKSS